MTAGPEIEKCPRCEKAVYEAESAFAGMYGPYGTLIRVILDKHILVSRVFPA